MKKPANSSDKKTVMVIGAGANADFRLKEQEEILAQIFNAPPSYTGLEKNIKKPLKDISYTVAMPTGEELVRCISDEKKILQNFYFPYFKKVVHEYDRVQDQSRIDNIAKTISRSFVDSSHPPFNLSLKDLNDNCSNGRLKEEDLSVYLIISRLCNTRIFPNGQGAVSPIRPFILDNIKNSKEFKPYFDIAKIVSYYRPFSIDELLDSIRRDKINIKINSEITTSKDDLIKAGKTLIALFLLQYEDKKIFENFDSVCWYRHIRNMVVTCGKSTQEIREKLANLTIISFNYDRSLDYFLRTKLEGFYDQIKILYPYNTLALDEVWEDGDYKEIPYGYFKKTTDDEWIKQEKIFAAAKKLGENLGIVGDLDNESEKKTQIRDKILSASSLYFLGFSFNDENCEVLGLFDKKCRVKVVGDDRHVYYTNYGDSKRIEKKFSKIFNRDNKEISKSISTKGAYDALALDFDLSLI